MASRAQPGSDPLPADADGKTLLSSSMRYKLRKKHPCPVELDQELKVKNARLPKPVHDGLNAWLKKHRDNPYPNKAEKETLSAKLGITPQQVSFISLFFYCATSWENEVALCAAWGGREKKEGGNLGECTMTPLCRGRRGERGLCLPGEGQDGVVCMGGWVCSMGGRGERERKGEGGKRRRRWCHWKPGGDFLEVLLPLDVHVLPPSTLHLLFLPGEVTVGERCVCAHVGTGKKEAVAGCCTWPPKKRRGREERGSMIHSSAPVRWAPNSLLLVGGGASTGGGDIDRGWKEEEGRGTSREERHSAPMSVAAGGWVGG